MSDISRRSHIELHIGSGEINLRARVTCVDKPVDYRILAALRAEAGVPNTSVLAKEVDSETFIRGENRIPVQFPHTPVEDRLIRGIEFGEGPQHAVGEARPQTGAVHHRSRTTEIHTGYGLPGGQRTQGFKFVTQQRFQTPGAGCKP